MNQTYDNSKRAHFSVACLRGSIKEAEKWLPYMEKDTIEIEFALACSGKTLEEIEGADSSTDTTTTNSDRSDSTSDNSDEPNDNFDFIQWLYSACPTLNIHNHSECAFRTACKHGNVRVARWLYDIGMTTGKPVDIHVYNDYPVRKACRSGNWDLLSWLFNLDDMMPFEMDDYYPFKMAARFGHNELAQSFYHSDPSVSETAMHYALKHCCSSGNSEMVSWILKTKKGISVRFNNDICLNEACDNNHLLVARILYYYDKTVNLGLNGGQLFRQGCNRQHIDLVEWLIRHNSSFAAEIKDGRVCRYRIDGVVFTVV